MNQQIRRNNVERFKGFGTLYDQNRPAAPRKVVDVLTNYLGSRPRLVADVGCGTGLSTWIWLHDAERIIGVEPSDDMRSVGIAKWQAAGEPTQLRFAAGMSHDLGLPDDSVDILTCSQSFHWMEPESTLREFARVLRPGGIFAAYDCDWPPSLDWQLEAAYEQLVSTADELASRLASTEQQAHKWSKEEHLQQIRQSGLFRYSREIVFHHYEPFTADRYANLALSQGGLQTALKLGATELNELADDFRRQAELVFAGTSKEVLFSYRMRMGIV
ncbi:class I SAM-dependent methyltransferase [Paenibacillus barcinonensis]|uniref:Class I SAM-dependent methyltransferase n=1 Tax=Paenibacillus barcinonensis TaxID=198119 RepID=A0A2V4VWP0_PAEBA|nr:class I SAM-dependent methyltransferase [Paenibacillus barcinonensis]PYE49618.1 ubiquinone/menaquinone biosynthesis C-methylase UbiE [Paenibacillus barcinonensis]QKS56670.1 class I SAM-dependent methyltransferase [Paenibacillus barcinonensis]